MFSSRPVSFVQKQIQSWFGPRYLIPRAFHVFLRFTPVTSFPVFPTCYAISHACNRLHDFSGLPPSACHRLPAFPRFVGYVFSRAHPDSSHGFALCSYWLVADSAITLVLFLLTGLFYMFFNETRFNLTGIHINRDPSSIWYWLQDCSSVSTEV